MSKLTVSTLNESFTPESPSNCCSQPTKIKSVAKNNIDLLKEKCEQDSAISDKLTGHTHNDKSHSRSCSLESAFAIRKTDDGIKCKVHSCDNPQHFHIFPILYLGVDFLLYPEVSSSSQPEWGNNVSFYTSAEASQFHGLRAPPHILA